MTCGETCGRHCQSIADRCQPTGSLHDAVHRGGRRWHPRPHRPGAQASGDAGPCRSTVLEYRKYACAQYACRPGRHRRGFPRTHLGLDHGRVTRGVIASAGYALGRRHRHHQQPALAPFAGKELRDAVSASDDVRLVNDFEAVAHAAALRWTPARCCSLTGPAIAPDPRPHADPRPGHRTWARRCGFPVGPRAVVLATEAGQAALTRRQRARDGAAGRDAEGPARTCRSNRRCPAPAC